MNDKDKLPDPKSIQTSVDRLSHSQQTEWENFDFGKFFIGMIMFCVGIYLFLHNIEVRQFSFNYVFLSYSGIQLTTGFVLFPLIFGIGMIFYNPDNNWGWILVIVSIALLLFGIISSLQMTLRQMSVFELISILVLFIGGLGLTLASMRRVRKT